MNKIHGQTVIEPLKVNWTVSCSKLKSLELSMCLFCFIMWSLQQSKRFSRYSPCSHCFVHILKLVIKKVSESKASRILYSLSKNTCWMSVLYLLFEFKEQIDFLMEKLVDIKNNLLFEKNFWVDLLYTKLTKIDFIFLYLYFENSLPHDVELIVFIVEVILLSSAERLTISRYGGRMWKN